MALTEKQILGPYVLLRSLGRGTFGEVWLARHHDLAEERALKFPTEPQYVQQLRREGKVIFELQHENIVRGFDVNTFSEPPYIAMEYVPGISLRQKLKSSGKLPADEAIQILRQILLAIGYAHTRGFLHRDLKPENVMLSVDGKVKVADFGLGKVQAVVAQSIRLSGSMNSRDGHSISGTIDYMSPQQKGCAEPDQRDDLYAVGIMACELLTGQRPGPIGVIKQLARSGVDERYAPVLEAALDDELDARYATAEAMWKAFELASKPAPAIGSGQQLTETSPVKWGRPRSDPMPLAARTPEPAPRAAFDRAQVRREIEPHETAVVVEAERLRAEEEAEAARLRSAKCQPHPVALVEHMRQCKWPSSATTPKNAIPQPLGLPAVSNDLQKQHAQVVDLEQLIAALTRESHSSLQEARSSLRAADDRVTLLRRDLDEKAPQIPAEQGARLAAAIEAVQQFQSSLVEMVPAVPARELLPHIQRLLNLTVATRTARRMREEYDKKRQVVIRQLAKRLKSAKTRLVTSAKKDLKRVVGFHFGSFMRSSAAFPLAAFTEIEPALERRPYPWDSKQSLVLAEQCYLRFTKRRRIVRVFAAATRAVLITSLLYLPVRSGFTARTGPLIQRAEALERNAEKFGQEALDTYRRTYDAIYKPSRHVSGNWYKLGTDSYDYEDDSNAVRAADAASTAARQRSEESSESAKSLRDRIRRYRVTEVLLMCFVFIAAVSVDVVGLRAARRLRFRGTTKARQEK